MVTLKWSLVFDKMTSLLQGCAVTMEISVLTLIFGTILGVMLALMRDSHIKVVSRLAQLYIWIWRGTPLMVQAFLIYFGLPNLGITFSAMTAGVLSMSLNTGAYIAEIVRSGIQSIHKGQLEAAMSLGFSKWESMVRIIIPQAIRNILPVIGNEFVTLIKESSQVSVIGMADLMYTAATIQGISFQPFPPLVIVAVYYFVMTFFVSSCLRVLEIRLKVRSVR